MVKQHLKIKQISFGLASEMLHFPSCNPPSFFGRKNVRFYFVDQHFDFDDNLHPRF